MSRVYVDGLHGRTREEDVEKFFNEYGQVREIMFKKGYGFVEFDDKRNAEDAVHGLDGKELLGERLHVEMARGRARRGSEFRSGGGSCYGDRRSGGGGRGGGHGRDGRDRNFGRRQPDRFGPPARTDHRLYVDNLSSNTTWQDLKYMMRKIGKVTFADKQGQHDGVVEFATRSDLKNALKKCDGMEIGGHRVTVSENRRPRSRNAHSSSGSRSRSRSHSRSHSHSRSRSRTPTRNSGGKKGDVVAAAGSKNGRKADEGGKRGRSGSRSASRSKSQSHSRSRSGSRSLVRQRKKSGSKDSKKSEEKKVDAKKEQISKPKSGSIMGFIMIVKHVMLFIACILLILVIKRTLYA